MPTFVSAAPIRLQIALSTVALSNDVVLTAISDVLFASRFE